MNIADAIAFLLDRTGGDIGRLLDAINRAIRDEAETTDKSRKDCEPI